MDNRLQAIAIFGGSFNPPHIAHVLACQYALCCWPLDRILVIPSFIHPFEKELESFSQRLEMTRLAFSSLGDRVEVSEIEQQMGKVSFTIDTIRELRKCMPDAKFHLIVGSDIVPEMRKWKDIEAVRREATPLVVPRLDEAYSFPPASRGFFLPDVSSTEIREKLLQGKDVGSALPWKVREYIKEHGLYKASA